MSKRHIKYKKFRGLKVKDVWFDFSEFENNAGCSIVMLHSYKKLAASLFDFKKSSQTMLIDLDNPFSSILENMESRTRWSIKKAQKEKVVVRKVDSDEEAGEVYGFFKRFYEQRSLPVPSQQAFLNCDIFVARDRETGQFLCFGGFLSFPAKNYIYKYGAGVHRGQESEAVLWGAIQHAKKQGFKIFDMGGVVCDPDHPSFHEGRFRFKRGFGGEVAPIFTYIRFENKLLKALTSPIKLLTRDIFSKEFVGLLDKLKLRKPLAKAWNRLSA